ncbi:hypothetical protein [Halorubrum sp. CBA1229]|uniref:hypothetical protein n=1 Tax=Halorubrum sp. CBA1229 TaxID=1853699 RepID=UPI0011CDD047|nr:hypothetical protein [Halorubrum sp. CBA1229]QKY18312.1 hypothetical protein Hrr1229_016010 [Halorubrum sp. CBA1229]
MSGVFSPATLANEGERSAVIRIKGAKIRFEPSGTEFSWEELQTLENVPRLKLNHLDNNSLTANSTDEVAISFKTGHNQTLESLFLDEDEFHIDAIIDIEDNVDHYEIEYSDRVEFS